MTNAMARKRAHHSNKLKTWDEARRRFRLSHAHVQMARELGMNPQKLGKLDNHHQEPWKAPLPDFIARLYAKRFGKRIPDGLGATKAATSTDAARMPSRPLSSEEFAALEAESPYPIEETLIPEDPFCQDDATLEENRTAGGA